MEHHLIIIVFVMLLSMFLQDYLNKPVWTLCDTEKCPYCCGTDFCETIQMNNIVLTHYTFRQIFSNYVSVKNVYKGVYKNESVVLKKLGHNVELDALDDLICVHNNLTKNCVVSGIKDGQNYEEKVREFLNKDDEENVKNFKSCDQDTTNLFVDKMLSINSIVLRDNYLKNLWTTLQMNAEPLVLQLLNKKFPIPHLYGACGRLIVLRDAGEHLSTIYYNEWIQRAYVALQLMKAAKSFTEDHEDFRFYLTDISPDNIVVNENLKITFIDFENVIIKKKSTDILIKHETEDMDPRENYSYMEDDICNSSISDHNIYAICKLLLSERAPYPMIANGLLHSPPDFIKTNHKNLFELIQTCENPTGKIDRFQASEEIISILETLLTEQNYEL